MLSALWKQRLDRHIARAIEPPGSARFDERQGRQIPHLDAWHNDSKHPYQTPGQRPNGPAAPGR